jgi:LysM repeat protein
MSTPSPLPSPGTLEGAASPKSRVRITVLTILALHVVVIGGLLLQGCDKGGKTASGGASNTVSALPPLVPDTNYFSNFPGDTGAAAAGQPSAAAAAQPAPGPGIAPPPTYPDAGAAGAAAAAGSPGAAGAGVGGLPPVASTYVPPVPSAPMGQGTEHVIKKGDTIGALAKKYGVTEQAIIDANPQAKPRSLKIDEKLTIPPPTPAAPGAVASAGSAAAPGASGATGEVYVVKPGDTLGKVAKKFGVTVKQLRAANNIKGDRILPKQRLNIPAKPAASAAGTGTPAPQ